MKARLLQSIALVALMLFNALLGGYSQTAHAEDTDIFTVNKNIVSARPNVLIIQDNTANWNTPFAAEKAALVSTVMGLDDRYNVGLMTFVETGGGNGNTDGAYMRAAVRQMTTANKTALANLVNAFDQTADKSNNGVYGLAMGEVYRYFGALPAYAGFTQVKRDAAGNSISSGVSAPASNAVFALPGNAFASMASNTYVSPVADNCQKNFVILISNGPAQDNASATSTATSQLQSYGGNTTSIALSPNGSQSNVGDEWARFMANSDVNAAHGGTQQVITYTVDVNPGTTGQGPGHTALLKSMALQGKGKYFAVTSDPAAIAKALNDIFTEVLDVNSVFAASSLPVSVNSRGSLLNQVYMGVFRPDGQASPRWPGNLKQYKVAQDSAGHLQLVDSTGSAIANNGTEGFIKNNVTSFWTSASTFWDSAYYPDAQGVGLTSDAPDGDLIEKGGAAQKLRTTYASDVTARKLYTCTGTGLGACTNGSTLSGYPFTTANTSLDSTALGISSTVSVSSITRVGTTATATSTAHGFSTGQSITITGASQTEYNGVFTITVTDTDHFTFNVIENPTSPAGGTIVLTQPTASFSITSLIRSSYAGGDVSTGTTDSATATTGTAHGLSAGMSVGISGANQTEYNGSFTVLTAPTTTSFTFSVPIFPTTPGTVISTSSATSGTSQQINAITRAGKTVTVTTKNNHGFTNGATVSITNVTPAVYNGSFTLSYSGANKKQFTYTLSALSPDSPATGTVSGAVTPASVTLSSLTRAAGSTAATGTTAANHGLSVGNTIVISGATPAAYNGTYTVASVPTTKTFTYNVTVTPVSPATGTITATTTGTTNTADLINWVRGENRILDDNPTATNTLVRGYLHGDVVHSRPAIVNYNRSGQPKDRDLAVFYGSNDGILHAVKGGQDPADGYELWGFIAPEFFKKFMRQYSEQPVINNSSATTSKPYFFDGLISTLTIDANGDGAIDSGTTGDKAYIYVGMRRGGRTLYAFDVTDMTSPKLQWKIDNTTPGFSALGQTWSEAKVAKIKGYANRVLIVSAGYDATANDSATQGTATMGLGVYVIDAITGAPIWYAGPTAMSASGLTSLVVSGMDYAIPADASPIDSDADGYVDRIYLADTGGNIWRANISALNAGNADPSQWTMNKLASLGGSGSNARKFLFGPDVVPFDQPVITTDSILIGSGDREQPFDVSIQNRFYMIKDSHGLTDTPAAVVGEGDLCDLTSDALQGTDATAKAAANSCLQATTSKGWFITLDTGEKVVTNSVTAGGSTTFGTNLPESTLSNTTSCSSGLGEARLYTISFKDATSLIDQLPADGVLNLADRYSKVPGGGLPPPPILITPEDGGETICSGPTCLPPPSPVIGQRHRVFWNILNEKK